MNVTSIASSCDGRGGWGGPGALARRRTGSPHARGGSGAVPWVPVAGWARRPGFQIAMVQPADGHGEARIWPAAAGPAAAWEGAAGQYAGAGTEGDGEHETCAGHQRGQP